MIQILRFHLTPPFYPDPDYLMDSYMKNFGDAVLMWLISFLTMYGELSMFEDIIKKVDSMKK
jgi:hypothetical protein